MPLTTAAGGPLEPAEADRFAVDCAAEVGCPRVEDEAIGTPVEVGESAGLPVTIRHTGRVCQVWGAPSASSKGPL